MKPNDKIIPKGIIPTLSRWIGSLWVLYISSVEIYALCLAWRDGLTTYPPIEFFSRFSLGLLGILLFVIPMSLPGLLVAGLFPSIRFDRHGIKYSSLFLGGLIQWDEVQSVAKVKRPVECLAIVISRPFSILNGLWFSTMHGRLAGVGKPVILLSMNWDDRDELMQEIQKFKNNVAIN